MAMLFGLGMLLTACDVADLNQLLADIMGTQPAPAEQTADEAGDDEAGDADAEGADGADDASEGGDDAAGGDGPGGDDAADAARERCLNRNEHLANLRTPERVDDGRRERRRERRRAEADESDDAQGGGASEDADDEAPAERATPSESRRNTGNGGGGNGGGGNGGGSGGQSAGGADTAGLSNIERQVFDLLMEERAAAGLEPLQLDSGLSQGARAWSRRMATEDFFSHDTSGGFAENIAYGYPTAAAVHDGWMGSDGHRRNRMNAGYRTYGIGVFEQGGTLYYTERFG